MTRLSPRLPKGDANGLGAIGRYLVDSPDQVHVLVVIVDCRSITTDVDDGTTEATARIRRIEAVRDPEDARRLRQILRRESDRRTGRPMLPIELEDDLGAALDGLAPES